MLFCCLKRGVGVNWTTSIMVGAPVVMRQRRQVADVVDVVLFDGEVIDAVGAGQAGQGGDAGRAGGGAEFFSFLQFDGAHPAAGLAVPLVEAGDAVGIRFAAGDLHARVH